MLPSYVERSRYRFVTCRLARAVSAVAALCSSILQRASDDSPSFR
jgi:hypothetical protein